MRKYIKNVLLIAGLLLWLAYRFRHWLYSFGLHLTPPHYRVSVRHDVRVPMRDGVTLATDHYFPQPWTVGSFPTILIRSPYGRGVASGPFGLLLSFFARRFAERGYQVLVQDTRGRFDSDGIFDPYFNEQNDGFATLDWLSQQPWFNGVVGLWGGSYLGIVQWVIAAESPYVKAIVPSITCSHLHSVLYPDGALDLGLAIRWMAIFQALDRYKKRPYRTSWRMLFDVERAITPAFKHLPVLEADTVALGQSSEYYRKWIQHTHEEDDLWRQANEVVKLEKVTAPTHLIGGWYDFFLRGLLQDYLTLKDAGHSPYLTIGPWHHFTAIVSFDDLREGLIWFDAHLKGDYSRLRSKPVKVFVMGANEWREMDSWPPPAKAIPLYLHTGRRLDHDRPMTAETTDHYRYDPADPTPALGGAQFSPFGGAHDNRVLEARSDVLTYTTSPLTAPLEVIGPVRLQLYAKSSLQHTDFFGRLCDVYPDGRSMNICDGLFRVEPGKGSLQPDGSLCIEIDMWATAYRFQPGHRIRLQVSSGAHPHWSRNLGTGDCISSTAMKTADQTIFHDDLHPSALILPLTRE